jgi:PAS domain S-box-containing protein
LSRTAPLEPSSDTRTRGYADGRRPCPPVATAGPRPSDGPPDRVRGVSARWLLVAIEHAADAIVVTDLDGTVQYVNAAFERQTGLAAAAVVGRPSSLMDTGEQPMTGFEEMMATVRRGETWSGDIVHRRGDGTVAHLAATVAPVRDESGAIVGAVTVRRDVSRERALEDRLDEQRRERSSLAAMLAVMRSRETAEATAGAIASAFLDLPGLGRATVWSFEANGDVAPLAILGRVGGDIAMLGPVPAERSAYLRERASHGPWIEQWRRRPGHPYNEAILEQGIRALAYVPIRGGDHVMGMLVASGIDGTELGLAECLPALVECAAMAGALLAPQLQARSAEALGTARIETIIAGGAFVPVFQPIVELESRTAVGYEALTRFADGTPPDRVFGEARACGLAIELETATLAAALEAAAPLPRSAWLNVNVSAELVLAGEPLGSILEPLGRQAVLELTEHVEVSDYAALRVAIARLGSGVRLAIDDAGAGFASFRHILELAPDYVKLDRGIIHGVGDDPARQALVAGMVHFAGKTGTTLIAEGVETAGEARELRALGVTLGQGYHLGRPALAGRLVRPIVGVLRAAIGAADHGGGRVTAPDGSAESILHAVNIGGVLAPALREIGISTVAELRAVGALATWERLRGSRPRLATGVTLLQLEGAVRGIRITQLPPADRARLRLLATLGREKDQATRPCGAA